jgi:hypothetical protein
MLRPEILGVSMTTVIDGNCQALVTADITNFAFKLDAFVL